MQLSTRTRRRLRFVRTRVRELYGVVKGLLSTRHPLLVHIIPIRDQPGLHLCNEFDDFSKPVELAEMLRRIDRLADHGPAVHHDQRRRTAVASDLDQISRALRGTGS